MKSVICVLGLFLAGGLAAHAQAPPDVEQKLKALEERIAALETELRAVKQAQAVTPAEVAPTASPAAPTPPAPAVAQGTIGGAPPAMANVLNPSVSVIGNFWGSAGKDPIRGGPALEMHETEIAFQAVVDPYARADFFVSLSPEGIELEEGYLTLTALPGGFVGKVGKMRAAFGRVNAMHNDQLPWIDRPLVTDNLVGGEEGINDAGLSVSRSFAGPGGIFLEGTAQVYRGESEGLFEPNHKRDLSLVSRLRGYHDLTEDTNLELGFSYARGYNESGPGFTTNLYGVDGTLRWKPLRRAIYNSFLWRTELVWSRRDQLLVLEKAFGLYTAAEYRLNRRWTVGGRFDRSGRANAAGMTDTGFSAILTYWPSEFSQIRGQYRFTRYAEQRDGNELRFQFLFNIGAHGAHPF